MLNSDRSAKINVKLLAILILVTLAVGISLVVARQAQRGILSETSLREGQAAFEKEDWLAACKHFKEYLSRETDNVEILRKYAKAAMSIRPLEASGVQGAIAAYRRIIQLDPIDEDAYRELAVLYAGIGNFNELTYIARTRLTHDPNDHQAPLWLATSLIRLNRTEEARQTLDTFVNDLDVLAEKSVEYVRACVAMSKVLLADNPTENTTAALKYLDKAVDGMPESLEARISRAQFYARALEIPGLSPEDRLTLARKDLETADGLEMENPQILLLLGSEWMVHGELEKAESKLEAAKNLPEETLKEHFFDVNDWVVVRFQFATELAKRRKNVTKGISLVNKALTILKEPRHRTQILPSAITLCIDANDVSDARRYLDEYLDTTPEPQSAVDRLRFANLQALVAKAEEKPYEVINVLEPIVVSESSGADLWRLLAEAYSRTNQIRRSVDALREYLRLHPKDLQMMLHLTNEYFKLQDWKKAFKTAQTAESLDPTNTIAKMLRIESGIHLAADPNENADIPKLEELSAELAQLSRAHPDRHEIHRMKAIIAEYVERPGESEKELKLAIEKSADSLAAKMQLVRYYHRVGKVAKAINVCRMLCERHSEAAEPWIVLSELHMANSEGNLARDCLQRGLEAVGAKNDKRSISIKLALLELLQDDRAAGIRRLNELAAQDKGEIRARTLLLGVREVREDSVISAKLISQLKEAEGESGLQWRLHEASLWLSSDEWRSRQQNITDHLQYCMASDPGWSAPVLLLADFYERLEDFSRVEDICRQALARNPSAGVIANRLLALLEKQGRFSEAEQLLRDLQKFDADPRLTSAWQVRIAVRTGDFSQAIDELKLRIANDDQDANLRIQLARLVYQQNRDTDWALQYLNQAEAITPDSISLIATRVSILMAEGRTKEARNILDDAVTKSRSFGAHVMRAEYFSNQGEFERAEKDYRELTTFTENGTIGYELLSGFYARNEKLDQAVMVLEEGVKKYPDDLKLKRGLMQFLFGRGQDQDRKRALEILTALEEQSPQDPGLMKVRAMEALREQTPQSIQSAREMLRVVVKLAPTDVEAHLMLINVAMQAGEYETARDSVIQALGPNPDNLALFSTRSRIELALENTRMAAQLANLVLQKDPHHAEMRDLFVTAALRSKDHGLLDEARTLIEADDGYSTNEGLLILRARVLAAMEKPQTAIPELEAYCQTENGSKNISALVILADLHRRAGEMDRAKRRIEQVEQMDPNSQTTIHARLLWMLEQNQLEELGGISSAYISAEQQNPNTLLAAATILSTSDSPGLRQEGLRLYEHTVKLFPTLVTARLDLASTLYQIGEIERAKAIYQELLTQHPNNIRALNDLAWILQEHDCCYSTALELSNRGLSLVPRNLHLLDTRGTILAHMVDRLSDAKIDFERLVELSPPDTSQQANALLKLGRICAKLNEHVQAKQNLERALEIDQKKNVFTTDERSEILRIIQGSGLQAASKDLTSNRIGSDISQEHIDAYHQNLCKEKSNPGKHILNTQQF